MNRVIPAVTDALPLSGFLSSLRFAAILRFSLMGNDRTNQLRDALNSRILVLDGATVSYTHLTLPTKRIV